MLVGPERATLFLGNFGSGKTEVAVNYALHLRDRRPPPDVVLADLDLVNPYFRSREVRRILEEWGVVVVVPDALYHHADLPILVPEVRAALMASSAHVLLDVGGDDVGARVLGALHDGLPAGSYRALMVVNARRPHTREVAGILRMREEIERSGRVSVTGFVSNTHLMEETTLEVLVRGWELAERAAEAGGVAVEFVCAPESMAGEVEERTGREVLAIRRHLLPPWREGGAGANGQAGRVLSRPLPRKGRFRPVGPVGPNVLSRRQRCPR